jgi:1,2-phenylacetyl-CoA epoxidase catalytic subunit
MVKHKSKILTPEKEELMWDKYKLEDKMREKWQNVLEKRLKAMGKTLSKLGSTHIGDSELWQKYHIQEKSRDQARSNYEKHYLKGAQYLGKWKASDRARKRKHGI